MKHFYFQGSTRSIDRDDWVSMEGALRFISVLQYGAMKLVAWYWLLGFLAGEFAAAVAWMANFVDGGKFGQFDSKIFS